MEKEVDQCISLFVIETQFATSSLSSTLRQNLDQFQDELDDAVAKASEQQAGLAASQTDTEVSPPYHFYVDLVLIRVI